MLILVFMIFKRATLNLPKLICMYICKRKFGFTLREISSYFEILRPETVSSKIGKFHEILSKNPQIFVEIDNIYQRIKENILKG